MSEFEQWLHKYLTENRKQANPDDIKMATSAWLACRAEADALIAGAYLAVDALISKGWHSDQCASLRNQWHIDDPEACDCWNGLLRASVRELPPDAARLALDKLIADTRLEEAEWWARFCDVKRKDHYGAGSARLATLRAAVQPGG